MLVGLAVDAEAAGWDGFFVWDHILHRRLEPEPVVDPWLVLAACAVRTQRIRLGTLITPVARRRPWKLAREVATLDQLPEVVHAIARTSPSPRAAPAADRQRPA